MKKEFKLTGITCSACKAIVEDICGDYRKISSATADVKKGSLLIEYTEGLDFQSLKEEIESEGDFVLEL